MNVERFKEIRLEDELILSRVLEKEKELVGSCHYCGGSGFIKSHRCKCMVEYSIAVDLILSGAPAEAQDVYEIINDGRRLRDPEYYRVVLSVDKHNIREINRAKLLYSDLVKPYLKNFSTHAVKNGESLLIFGTNSTGKTWVLYFILANLAKHYSVFFILLKDLINTINIAMYSNMEEDKKKHRQILNLIRDVDMLLIDEGSKISNINENVSVQLEAIIKERVGNRKPFVMATNHAPLNFLEIFGASTISAFIKNVYSLHILNGPDLRAEVMDKSDAFNYIKEIRKPRKKIDQV